MAKKKTRAKTAHQREAMTLPVFVHNGECHYLAELIVLGDGMLRCWFEDFDLAGLEERVASGWLVTALPEKARVSIFPFGELQATKKTRRIAGAELVKEVRDAIDHLNGRPTSDERCRKAFAAYEKKPGEATREALRAAYEAVPEHNRRFVLGDQDRKAGAIEEALAGKKKKKKSR